MTSSPRAPAVRQPRAGRAGRTARASGVHGASCSGTGRAWTGGQRRNAQGRGAGDKLTPTCPSSHPCPGLPVSPSRPPPKLHPCLGDLSSLPAPRLFPGRGALSVSQKPPGTAPAAVPRTSQATCGEHRWLTFPRLLRRWAGSRDCVPASGAWAEAKRAPRPSPRTPRTRLQALSPRWLGKRRGHHGPTGPQSHKMEGAWALSDRTEHSGAARPPALSPAGSRPSPGTLSYVPGLTASCVPHWGWCRVGTHKFCLMNTPELFRIGPPGK